MATKIVSIPLNQIFVGKRLRTVDQDHVQGLALSIEQNGLNTPVLVSSKAAKGYRLVAGLHRLEAVKLLGWDSIDAKLSEGNDLALTLQEIDENLFRRELNALHRAIFLARRKAIWEELHPETKHGGDRKGDQVANLATRFSADTAEKIGLSERAIQRAVALVAQIHPEVIEQIATTWLADKGSELDALARLTPAEQKKAVKLVLREKDPLPSISAAAREIKGVREDAVSDDDKDLQKMMSLWRGASPATRRNFRAWLDTAEASARIKKAA